ncbi:hypothetical protein BAY60_27750 [Prauserella muralis]|uniref:Uncharacterized protein n=1 Tax=Prauserella muralis TaxID=588067 RepID=A0A2V4ALS4_9PSEU|nr:hypothetical protein BAY60_27750 [Prauserella muralis]
MRSNSAITSASISPFGDDEAAFARDGVAIAFDCVQTEQNMLEPAAFGDGGVLDRPDRRGQ